jgi:hypothetical protein
MPPAAAREEKLGAPQTPAGDFAPCTPFKFALLGAPQIPAGGLCPPVTCHPDRVFPLLNSYKDF